jgi:deoxyribose-phosphate aldolase
VSRDTAGRLAGAHRMAAYIDHTLLRSDATRADIERLCDEALAHGFAAVCVNPAWVELCAARLKPGAVTVATVNGFPLGACTSREKAFAAALAVKQGAGEIDAVIALGLLRGGDWEGVHRDLASVVDAAAGCPVKAILETATLSETEIVRACELAELAGASFVKTSTGFHPAGGATVEAVALMRRMVGDRLGVKASGGIRDCSAALRMLGAGADRIGASSGTAIVRCLGERPFERASASDLASQHQAQCQLGASVAPREITRGAN